MKTKTHNYVLAAKTNTKCFNLKPSYKIPQTLLFTVVYLVTCKALTVATEVFYKIQNLIIKTLHLHCLLSYFHRYIYIIYISLSLSLQLSILCIYNINIYIYIYIYIYINACIYIYIYILNIYTEQLEREITSKNKLSQLVLTQRTIHEGYYLFPIISVFSKPSKFI